MLQTVMWNSENLVWIDLSQNLLTTIDDELLHFPHLKTLYLHANYINNMEEVKKLAHLKHLTSLTLFGNDLERIQGYRLYVVGILTRDRQIIKKLDQVLVTKLEYNNCIVWNEYINANKTKKLKKLFVSENPRHVPTDEEVEEERERRRQSRKNATKTETQSVA